MKEIPADNFSPLWVGERPEPSQVGGEREILTGFLDRSRRTFELKCEGVPVERLSEKGVPPSGLSLRGIVRHLAAVERWWFRIQFAGEELPMLYYSDDDPDQDFEFSGGDFATDLAAWRAECEASRRVVAASSLDDTGLRGRNKEAFSLRWLLVDMIDEYARHLGHADLLRERIDGATGF